MVASPYDTLVVGGTDADGREIIDIYAKQDGRYAVYQTPKRVVVLYAEDPLVQRNQRKRLIALSAVRSEINGQIAGWRASRWRRLRESARDYDGRIAAALVDALEDGVDPARDTLQLIRDEIGCERQSRARLYYLLYSVAMVAAVVFAALVAVGKVALFNTYATAEAAMLWRSVEAGVLGAFYSIALSINDRNVRSDRRPLDHFTDAAVRISVGAIAALVLSAFLVSGVIVINFGGTGQIAASGPPGADGVRLTSWPITLIAGFLAGFAERLVPDLLKSYAIDKPAPAPAATTAASARPAADGAAAGAATEAASPDEDDAPTTPPSPEEEVDACDVDLAEEAHATPDDRLPVASGGVARD